MNNRYQCIVPECYFDTVLLKKILNTNERLLHTKGCNNVINRFRIFKNKKGNLYDKFGIGIIDKDKREIDYLKNDCEVIVEKNNVILWRNKNFAKHHFIIQLNPPLENWVENILTAHKKSFDDFGFSNDIKEFKKQILFGIENENDERLNKLITWLINSSHPSIEILKTMLNFLVENNYNADVEKLKNECHTKI